VATFTCVPPTRNFTRNRQLQAINLVGPQLGRSRTSPAIEILLTVDEHTAIWCPGSGCLHRYRRCCAMPPHRNRELDLEDFKQKAQRTEARLGALSQISNPWVCL